MADPNRSPRLDVADKQRICKLIRQGLSIREAAESMGRRKSQVVKAVARMGGVKAIREERVRA